MNPRPILGALLLINTAQATAAPGDGFKSIDDAVFDVLLYLTSHHPDWKRYEYAGCIYLEGNAYKASPPETLPEPSPIRCKVAAPPQGTTLVGEYHNHTSKEDFSPIDLDLTPKHLVPQFLLTPKGVVKKYDPADETVVILKGLKV